jgi:hypothetical protein
VVPLQRHRDRVKGALRLQHALYLHSGDWLRSDKAKAKGAVGNAEEFIRAKIKHIAEWLLHGARVA